MAGYRAEGYRRFQFKVGGDPWTDIERIRAVAAELQDRRPPGGRRQYRLADARRPRVVRAVQDIDVYIEQPCLSYEECLTDPEPLRPSFVLDE